MTPEQEAKSKRDREEPFDLRREIFTTLYNLTKPQGTEDISNQAWEKYPSPITTTPAIRDALNFFCFKGLLKKDRSSKFLLSQEGKRLVEELYLARYANIEEIEESYDQENDIGVKALLPELLSKGLDVTIAQVTWRKLTPLHGFRKTTEVFIFQSPGQIILGGKEIEVSEDDVVTLPPRQTIKLVPYKLGGLAAVVFTRPRFDPQDMFVVEDK